jgi:hypothetical protein
MGQIVFAFEPLMMEGDPGINHIQIAYRFKNPAGEESMTFDHSEIIFFRFVIEDVGHGIPRSDNFRVSNLTMS